jgi:hypothetical protein
MDFDFSDEQKQLRDEARKFRRKMAAGGGAPAALRQNPDQGAMT